MIIPLIDQSDGDSNAFEVPADLETTETTAHDHHMGPGTYGPLRGVAVLITAALLSLKIALLSL